MSSSRPEKSAFSEPIILLLGSNLGDRLSLLAKATQLLQSRNIEVIDFSRIYETASWGITDQPSFLNMAVRVSTDCSPEELLNHCLSTELEMGRTRIYKWGNRNIDIDIIYFGDKVLDTNMLKLPHPEVQHRKFALMPICDLIPTFMHPLLQKSQVDLLRESTDQLECSRTTFTLPNVNY